LKEVVIISGTNRQDALSPIVAKSYAKIAEEIGISPEIIDLRDLPEDYLSTALYENSGKNAGFNKFREKMSRADKFIFIVPEYNGSFPGVLKAFIDGLDFPDTFTGKKCALVGLSAGMLGSSHAMSHLTDILNYCGTHVLARKPRFTKIRDCITDGNLTHEPYLDQLRKQINELIKF
jgi:chromate reductase, NAD(P)H dehydrogenase (quinone)